MAVDFDALVNKVALATFGSSVTWQRGETTATLAGNFLRHHTSLNWGADGAEQSVRQPAVGVRLADFPTGVVPQQHDIIIVDGQQWKVMDVKPDDSGWAHLLLSGLPTTSSTLP